MASELRRAAKALVESRVETFESVHGLAESRSRLDHALAALGAPRALALTGTWSERGGHAVYEATFAPSPGTRRFLNALSLALVLLLAGSGWAFLATAQGAPVRFFLPFSTVFAVIAMPFVVNAAASRREAEEARIRRALRVALRDENPAYPPPQRWPDEE